MVQGGRRRPDGYRKRIIRPRDVEARGIARENLLRLHRRGVLTRTTRGVYILGKAGVTEHHTLAVAAKDGLQFDLAAIEG